MTNAFLISALAPHLNDAALAQLDTPQALASWYDVISHHGNLEIPARYSKSGNPVVLNFTAKNQLEIDGIEAKAEALRAAGDDDAADELCDTVPFPIWG